MPARALSIAGAVMKPAQAEMAVSGERPHTVGLAERQRGPVMSGSAFGVEKIGLDRDFAKKTLRVSSAPRLVPRGFN